MITHSNWRYRCNGFVWLWPEAYLEVDGAGVVVEWNPRAEEVFGWRRAEVVGRLAAATLLPGTLGEPIALVAGAVVGERRHSPWTRPDESDHVAFELRHRAGHLVAVEGRLFVTGLNGDHGVGGFITPCGSDRLARGDEELLRELGLVPDLVLPSDPELLHDPLTGLPNRTNFERQLADAVAPPDVPSGGVGVVLLDLDRFKSINTSLGYGTGDMVLAMVAERLLAAAGDAVLVARSGGDEFLALFHSRVDGAHARASAFADRARHVLARPFEVAGTEVFLGASIGMALNTFGVDDAASLLANAESAMYQAKNRGGACVETYGESMRIQLLDRMTTEHSLHRALERSELMLHYQPVVELGGATTVGVEALIRWQHPEQGLVAPYRFIPVAEESGLIIPIGAWVLEQACHQLHDWHQRDHASRQGSVEVNLSARQIDDPLIVRTVEGILDKTGLPPEHLTLEITESALMKDAASALAVLSALKELGVLLAIDDFGTGYSSLSYLQHFPLDLLKVDRTFVEELGVSDEAGEIVGAVIKLAHALGLEVVAEGVETTEQLELLRSFDCDLAQGYLFSRPLPADEIVTSFGLPVSA
jgi:diguanylate cyclase (GGDEF)-like protein/PAS domain S-box-containing protein